MVEFITSAAGIFWILGIVVSLLILLIEVAPYILKQSESSDTKTRVILNTMLVVISFLFSYVNLICILALSLFYWGNRWEIEAQEDKLK